MVNTLSITLLMILINLIHVDFAHNCCGFNGSNSGCSPVSPYLVSSRPPNAVPKPKVQINFDNNTHVINIVANVTYFAQNAGYVLRFSPFDKNSDQPNIPGTCENRLDSTFNGKTYAQYWTHESNAMRLLALGNTAYSMWGPSNGWNQTALSCDTVRLFRSFSFSDLATCKSPQGKYEVTMEETNQNITYRGYLYISLVTPVSSSSNQGHDVIIWSWPFSFTVMKPTVAISEAAGGGERIEVFLELVRIIQSGDPLVGISNQGKLHLEIRTVFNPNNYGIVTNNRYLGGTGVPMTIQSNPNVTGIVPGPVTQRWTWYSTSISSNYDGIYSFSWDTYSCPNSVRCNKINTYTTVITVVESSSSIVTDINAYSMRIDIYTNSSFTALQSGPYENGQELCALASIQVAVADNYYWKLLGNNIYLCTNYNETTPVEYDGVNKRGCLDQPYRVQFLQSMNLTNNTFLLSTYAPLIARPSNFYSYGLCFTILDRIDINSTVSYPAQKQYLHFESKVEFANSSRLLANPNRSDFFL